VTAALFERFDAYMAVMVETPYCPDRVQALGMSFADQWNSDKALICDLLGEDPDDFDYAKWRLWVPRLKALDALQCAP
jgi:hypothetical protein